MVSLVHYKYLGKGFLFHLSFIGRIGRGDKEGVSSISVTGWSAWNSTWGWMRSR